MLGTLHEDVHALLRRSDGESAAIHTPVLTLGGFYMILLPIQTGARADL